ncbi:uncharacterized protein LOC119110076 [Pollicipes pollicipes]|uniref:uncharacterized protein LOC119110076 n=1 Tax=Pollicipes pollicipes TaxID=41117 RepID=UPI00188505D7|nr:uncharacterized protein LOC119110076 [Pollicipes pollicipes]
MLVEGCLPVMLLVILSCRHHLARADEEHFINDPHGLTQRSGPVFDDFEPDVYDDDEFHFKRALSYGHFRFGKRAPPRPPAAKRLPDYGHMKFGRRSPDYGFLKFGRRSPDYGHMKFGKRECGALLGSWLGSAVLCASERAQACDMTRRNQCSVASFKVKYITVMQR